MTEGATGPRLRRPHTPPGSTAGEESQYGACTATAGGREWRREEGTTTSRKAESCWRRFLRRLFSLLPRCCFPEREEATAPPPASPPAPAEIEMSASPEAEAESDLERGDSPPSLLQEPESQAVAPRAPAPETVPEPVPAEPAPQRAEQEASEESPPSRTINPTEEEELDWELMDGSTPTSAPLAELPEWEDVEGTSTSSA